MIIEGIVTTLGPAGEVHVAPMGPEVADDPQWETRPLVLKPYASSSTYRNLRERGEGVFHLTDDVMVFARGVLGTAEPAVIPAEVVSVPRLADCCRYDEFRICAIDDRAERVRLTAEIVHTARVRDFVGFNRARHAVIEAAILASRCGILPHQELLDELPKLRMLVEKTGGTREREAFDILADYIASYAVPPHSPHAASFEIGP